MTYDIEIRQLEPQTVASIRASTIFPEIGNTFRQLLPELLAYLAEIGVPPVGRPYTRYFRFSPEGVDLEVGVPVTGRVSGNGRIEPGELPGGEVATTVHIGPYDQITAAYQTLGAWIPQNGREERDAVWEVYMTDPSMEPDPKKLQTALYWPIK